jgi:type III restriction enzyme
MTIHLKDFQESAINQLSLTFLELWKTGNYKIPLIFKAPTGAGKTIMMAEFLRCLDDNYQFHEDKAYIWISFGGDESYSQSKNKLYDYYNKGTDMNLKDISNLNEGKLYKNNIFFINWAKIKGTDKESKKLRKPNEHTDGEFGIFDEFIHKTKKERDIVLIVDEAHTETDTTLANEVIELINPRIILKVTATPKNETELKSLAFDKKAGFVEVSEEDVIKSGLIKEKIIIQTEEEIKKLENGVLSEDEVMLELAFNKRTELKKQYEELSLDINPLVLIQLPSDEKEKEEVVTNKKDMVLSYLKQKGIKENQIAIWLSGSGDNKKNLESIEKNNNEICFMIFKVAPATGWDCPRADVLVMFREIGSPSFHTQIIGRIKRMPEGRHYPNEELNKAYIYTNYNKNHIKDIKEVENGNKPPIYYSKLKQYISPIKLETTFQHRTDFNTLTPPTLWQKSFIKSLDNYFGTKLLSIDFSNNIKVVKEKINLEQENVNNQIIVEAEIKSFDNFIKEIKDKGKNLDYRFSQSDIEKLYNLLCFEELQKQQIEDAKYNPSRSWGQLKQALNVWFSTRFGLDRSVWYKITVNELLNQNSELKKSIQKALIEFRETYNIEIKEKEEKDIFELTIPEQEISFTEDFEELNTAKNAYEKLYIKKNYKGRDNEIKFIEFLESQNIDWWHKQADNGRNSFAIEYYDTQEKKIRLFYPDFIVKKENKVYLLDTKSGNTAKAQETADKSMGLQQWINEKEGNYAFEIIGGITDFKHPNWRINKIDN